MALSLPKINSDYSSTINTTHNKQRDLEIKVRLQSRAISIEAIAETFTLCG